MTIENSTILHTNIAKTVLKLAPLAINFTEYLNVVKITNLNSTIIIIIKM